MLSLSPDSYPLFHLPRRLPPCDGRKEVRTHRMQLTMVVMWDNCWDCWCERVQETLREQKKIKRLLLASRKGRRRCLTVDDLLARSKIFFKNWFLAFVSKNIAKQFFTLQFVESVINKEQQSAQLVHYKFSSCKFFFGDFIILLADEKSIFFVASSLTSKNDDSLH